MKYQNLALSTIALAVSSEGFAPSINFSSRTGLNTKFKSPSLHATTGSHALPPQDDEVQRLKAMAAKLREEAASLEQEQKKAIADATQKVFQRFDVDGNGELSFSELKQGLEKLFKTEIPQTRAKQLFDAFDSNGDGSLQMNEFVGVESLRSKLNAIEREEFDMAREQAQQARMAQEAKDLAKMQMELVNDNPPTATDKVVSVLPYLFPLIDGLSFGRFFIEGNQDNPLAVAALVTYGLYRSIPFAGFLSFFGLNFLSENPKINKLVRFNLQQAVFLDFALFAPTLLGALGAGLVQTATGSPLPPAVSEIGSDAMFLALLAAVGYSTVSSLLGETPNKLPLISQRVESRMITPEMFDADGKFAPFDEDGNLKKPTGRNENEKNDN